MQHAKLSPSRAARRMVCPGSRALEETYPDTNISLAAREGITAHWVAQQYLLGIYDIPEFSPNEELITNEMLEGADLYENNIKSILSDTLHIEERIDISIVHPDCWGTPDCWGVVDNHLYIFDYKFGHGVIEAYENWQLLEYAAGISQLVSFEKVTLAIIQPRSYIRRGPIRSWTITTAELLEYIDKLRNTEFLAMEPGALCNPSPECKYCSARSICSALQNTVGYILDIAKSNSYWPLSNVHLGFELKHLRKALHLLEARLTGLEEQTKSRISKGEYIPGFKLESGRGGEYWTKDISEILTLGELMGLDLSKPQEVVTPSQARKIGIHEEILHEYSRKTSGKLKLVEETGADRIFKK